MTPDGLIPLIEDRAGVQNRIHISENLLDLPKPLVLEGCLLCHQRGVRPENLLPVGFGRFGGTYTDRIFHSSKHGAPPELVASSLGE